MDHALLDTSRSVDHNACAAAAGVVLTHRGPVSAVPAAAGRSLGPTRTARVIEQKPYAIEQKLLTAWVWLHCVTLVSVLVQKSAPAVILGRYSNRSFAILVFFLITLPVTWGVTRWLARNLTRIALPPTMHRLLFAACVVSLFGAWAFHVGPTRGYAVARLYATLVVFSVGIWSLRHISLPRRGKMLPPLIAITSAALLFGLTMAYPGVKWTDEGYTASAAWSYAQTGEPVVTIFRPMTVKATSMMLPGLGAWFELFGVSVAAARTFTFSLALGALAITFVTARSAFGDAEAWAAVIVGMFGFVSINYLFRDIETAVLLAAAYAAFVAADRSGKSWLHLLAGLAVGFSVDGHPVAYRFGVAFAAAYALEWARLMVRQRRWVFYPPLAYLVIGGAISLGLYVGFYRATNADFVEQSSGSPFFLQSPASAWRILREQFDSALIDLPLVLGLSVFGMVAVGRQNTRLDRLLLLSVIGAALILAALYERHRQYYLMHSLVPLTLAGAAGLHWVRQHYPAPKQAAVMTGIVVMATAGAAGALVDGYAHRHSQSYDPALHVARAIRAIVPRDMTLVGIDPFFFELSDYEHFMDITTPHQGEAFEPDTLAGGEAWQALAPEAVAVVAEYPLQDSVAGLVAYVQSQPELQRVRCWSVEGLGRVELFMRSVPPGVTVREECELLDTR